MKAELNDNQLILSGKKNSKFLPGPKGFMEPIKTYKNIRNEALGEYVRLLKKYGDLVYLDWPRKLLFVFDPKVAGNIFKENFKNYYKGKNYDEIKPILGNGLVTSNGEFWRQQRRLMAPEFHLKKIQDSFPQMRTHGNRLIYDLMENEGKELDISEDFMKVTFHAAADIFLGYKIKNNSFEVRESLKEASIIALNRIYSPFKIYKFFPLPSNFKFNKHKKVLWDMVDEIYSELREKKKVTSKENVFSRLIASIENVPEGEKKEKLVSQIKDEVITLLLAGHETTASTLSWAVYLLATNPDYQAKLIELIQERVGSSKEVTFEDLNLLPEVLWAIYETMRLYPAVPMISRTSKEDQEIEGKVIKGGTLFAVVPYIIHRREDLWKDPLTFDPERFSPERAEGIKPYSFLPFGEGPRKCIGYDFALKEAQLFLIQILQRFSFQLAPGFRPIPTSAVTLMSKNGMKVILKKLR